MNSFMYTKYLWKKSQKSFNSHCFWKRELNVWGQDKVLLYTFLYCLNFGQCVFKNHIKINLIKICTYKFSLYVEEREFSFYDIQFHFMKYMKINRFKD